MVKDITEEEARTRIIEWAKHYFSNYGEEEEPKVEVVSISYDKEEEEWSAELEVSTSEDNPSVVFWLDDQHGLQVEGPEY
jgi:hypothetical protein